eukprot:6958417-Pyramimonas_sp.AAC.1
MARALRAANMPQAILYILPTAVNDCRGRRKWLPPASQTAPTLRLSIRVDLTSNATSFTT